MNNPQKRWNDAAADAQASIQTLIDIQSEYQSVYDEMTEFQEDSDRGQAISAICDLDLDNALAAIQEAASINLPRL
jgi:hypothetical protein